MRYWHEHFSSLNMRGYVTWDNLFALQLSHFWIRIVDFYFLINNNTQLHIQDILTYTKIRANKQDYTFCLNTKDLPLGFIASL